MPFRPDAALLVIDVQEDYSGRSARAPFPYPGTDRLIPTINALLALARTQGAHPIFVRHEFEHPLARLFSRCFCGNTGLAGTPGALIDSRLCVGEAPQFTKARGDAFSNPALRAHLRQRAINQVVLTGLDAALCVQATARGALRHGFSVTVVDDAVVTRFPGRWRRARSDLQRRGVGFLESGAI